VRIQANPVKLASYGLNMEDLRTALTDTSVNSAKGNFDGPRQDYQIDSNDQITEASDYAERGWSRTVMERRYSSTTSPA